MILYKYYGFDSGLKALRSSQLGFRKPKHFNDPFELTYLSNVDGPDSKQSQLETELAELKNSVAILSLTRTPLNPLMWAHYGEEHTGFVIGYETDDEFLKSETYNLVSVDDGDVVYTNTKNPHVLDPESMRLFHQVYLAGQGINVSPTERAQINSLIRRVFLTKYSSWVYEEEVRVVKVWQSLLETAADYQGDPLRSFYSISMDVAPSYSCQLVKGLFIYRYPVKIKEVYLGVRNPLLPNNIPGNSGQVIDSTLVEKANKEKWALHSLNMARNSWGLISNKLQYDALTITEKDSGLINNFRFSGKEAAYLRKNIPEWNISENEELEMTNWDGQCYLKLNGDFIET